jgi:hypothetical protein
MRKWLVAVLLFTLFGGFVSARTETEVHPFLEMLDQVPAQPETRTGILYYADLRAAEQARAGAAQPESWAELEALEESDDLSGALWNAGVLMGLNSSSSLHTLFQGGDSLPDIMGFDFFDVDRALEYGDPPYHGLILQGDFDTDAINTALTSRGFVREEPLAGFPLWCSEAGCEAGAEVDLPGRQPADPFGGRYGQRQPILNSENYLSGSPHYSLVEAHAEVISGERSTLADLPDYQAVVEATTREGIFIQAWIVDPLMIAPVSDPAILLAPPAEVEDLLAEMEAAYIPIQPYSLLMIADTATETEQIAYVALVYNDQAAAEEAASVIPARIADYTSIAARRPFTDLLEERDLTFPVAEVYASELTGKFVVLIPFRGPIAGDEPLEDDVPGQLPVSSMAFRLLVNMISRADTDWLAYEF